MPQVSIENSSGPAQISYTIATPESSNAEIINPLLPSVILLHPIYMSQVIFHYQFASPELRRFNLIALDSRCHGLTSGIVPRTYNGRDAAEDIFCFMEALKLPPCHFFGVSFGARIALDMAIAHPKSVLSLFMLSPLPLVEPEIVAAGRQEIYECWVEGHQDPDNPNEEASRDAVFGALQLGFNHDSASFVNALIQYNDSRVNLNWSKDHFEEFHTISVDFFLNSGHSSSNLKNVTCPVHLVHCSQDIAYPVSYAQEILEHMKQSGIDARLSEVPGAPHFGCATHPEPVNTLFYTWMLELLGDAQIKPVKGPVTSPYEADLIRCGLRSNDQLSDSDDDLVITS